MTSAAALPVSPAPTTDAAAGGEALVGLRRSSVFLPELESVRGIAVTLVFAFHADALVRFPFIVPTTTLPLAFVRAGFTGVDLFFVLSAFLLSLPLLAEAAGGRRVRRRDYFARRALRILPLYYAAVLTAAVLRAEHPGDLRRALPYLLFLDGIPGVADSLAPYNAVWWSLATEVQFYLILPLLPLFLRSRAGRRTGAVLLGAYALAYAAVIQGRLRMGSIAGQMALLDSVFGRGPLFLWGIAAAAIYHHAGDALRTRLRGSRWVRLGGADVVLLALVLGNAVFLRWLVSIGPAAQMGARNQWWHIVNGGLWTAFILLLLLAPLWTKRLFANPVLARLGILSYSIYLIHHPFMNRSLNAVRSAWPHHIDWGWKPFTYPVILALAAGCVALSALTYRFIERPFLVRKARFDR